MRQSVDPSEGSTHKGFRWRFFQLYVAFLLGVNGVLLLPNVSYPGTPQTGTAFAASWTVMHLVAVGVLISSKTNGTTLLSLPLVLGALATASSLWSSDPASSLLYGGMLTGNILIARQMALELSPTQILELLSTTIILICALGIIFYYLGMSEVTWYDTRGRTNPLGGELLRGFFPHRIAGALYAIVGVLAVWGSGAGVRRIVAAVIVAWFLLLTASATGYVLALVAVVAVIMVRSAVRKSTPFRAFFWSRIAVGGLIIALIAISWDRLLGALGRDASLTGRTFLWEWGFRAWIEKPIVGWGYNAYFESEHAQYIHASIAELRYYDVPHFHQSFIQTAADLGTIGLVILVVIVVLVVTGSYRLSSTLQSGAGATFFALSVVLVTSSFVGYTFPEYNHFGTFLLFLIYYVTRIQDQANAAESPPLRSAWAAGGHGNA